MVVLIDGLGGSNTCKIYYNTVPAYILKDTPIDKGGNLSSPSRFFAVYEKREERRRRRKRRRGGGRRRGGKKKYERMTIVI